MDARSWNGIVRAREEFKSLTRELEAASAGLGDLLEELRKSLGYDDYAVETPIVYNEALDELGPGDRVAYILVADNPGKKEQLAANRRYLVGQSGKLAAGFFARELGVDFRREVLILNKTPVHTPKTAELRKLLTLAEARAGRGGAPGRRELEALLARSQVGMAGIARRLHGELRAPLWISGMGELGPRGIFRAWAEALGAAYADAPASLRDSVWLWSHFSMNRFAIELRGKRDPALPLAAELARLGAENRRRVLGW